VTGIGWEKEREILKPSAEQEQKALLQQHSPVGLICLLAARQGAQLERGFSDVRCAKEKRVSD
jgi:hypothetical protein